MANPKSIEVNTTINEVTINPNVTNLSIDLNTPTVEVITNPVFMMGSQGLDAYEVAVQEGFNGTKKEWLESIKGELYGNIDGGKANSNYGGIPVIFGGNAEGL